MYEYIHRFKVLVQSARMKLRSILYIYYVIIKTVFWLLRFSKTVCWIVQYLQLAYSVSTPQFSNNVIQIILVKLASYSGQMNALKYNSFFSSPGLNKAFELTCKWWFDQLFYLKIPFTRLSVKYLLKICLCIQCILNRIKVMKVCFFKTNLVVTFLQ